MTERASPLDREHRQQLVLLALETSSTQLSACEAAGVSYSTFKQWKRDNEEFAEAVLEARAVRQEHLRDMVQERAFNGYKRQVMYKGERMWERYPPGHEFAGQVVLDNDFEPVPLIEHVMSDQVFLRHAEANLPEYRSGKGGGIAVSTEAPGGGKTTVQVNFVEPPNWDDVEWDDETGRAKGVGEHGTDSPA